MLEMSKARIAVVDDITQMEKLHQIKDKLPHLKAVVQTMPPYAQFLNRDYGYWRWNDMEDLETKNVEEEYQKRLSSIVAN